MTYRRGVDCTSRGEPMREPVVGARQPQIFCSFLWSYGPNKRPDTARRLAPGMKVSG